MKNINETNWCLFWNPHIWLSKQQMNKFDPIEVQIRECFDNRVFLCWIHILLIQFLFTEWIQITKLRNLFNYLKRTSYSITYFLYQIELNNWTLQIIEFSNFKLPNLFRFWIEIETNYCNYCQVWVVYLIILPNSFYLIVSSYKISGDNFILFRHN